MSKFSNDKYYTPSVIAEHCWDKIDEIIGVKNIDVVIDSSVGGGAFCHYKKRKVDIAVDIEPDFEEINGVKVIKQDYLEWVKEYYYKHRIKEDKKVLVGFNVPFGSRNNLALAFFKESTRIADYIAFILPISQYNNNYKTKEWDLIYSEDLGEQEYSGVRLHCCFNIYTKREFGKIYNNEIESSDIIILRNDKEEVGGKIVNKRYRECKDYDIRMGYWGESVCGKIIEDENKNYCAEYKIIIDNKNKDKNEIIKFIKTFNWKSVCHNISAPKLTKQKLLSEISKRFNINQVKESESILRYL